MQEEIEELRLTISGLNSDIAELEEKLRDRDEEIVGLEREVEVLKTGVKDAIVELKNLI